MNKAQKIIKRDLQEAQYIGEDGGMVIDGNINRFRAYRKMLDKIAVDCGEDEVKAYVNHFKAEDLGRGWLHLVKASDRKKFDSDTEWYISIKESSPYEVWIYWG